MKPLVALLTTCTITCALLLGQAHAQTPSPTTAQSAPSPTPAHTPATSPSVTPIASARGGGPPTPEGPRRPTNLQLVFLGPTVRLTWEEPDFTQFFTIRIGTPGSAQTATFTVIADVRSFDLPAAFVPRCGGPMFVYGVAAVVTAGSAGFTAITASDACVQPTDQQVPSASTLPGTGAGASEGTVRAWGWSIMLVAFGIASCVGAVVTRRRA